MDLTSRLEGYLNHQIAYINPIPTLPVPKTLNDKKDTTLLEMAMKAFVKERLFGRLHNYEKDNMKIKNHRGYQSSSTTYDSRCLSSIKQIGSATQEAIKKEKNISNIKTTSPIFFTDDQQAKLLKTRQLKEKQKAINLQQKRLSAISSSFDFKAKVFPQTKSLITSHARLQSKPLGLLHQSFNLKNHPKNDSFDEYEQHPGTSFISAIDYYQHQKQPFIEKTPNQKLKLPEILDKKKSMTSKLELTKNQKNYSKKQNFLQVSIKDQLWSFLSKNKSQKFRKTRAQKSIQLKESLASIIKWSDGLDENKNLSSLKNDQTSFLNKEALHNYLNNPKISIPFFMLSVMNFFQLMSKITDKLKKSDFQSYLSILSSHPDRAWCVAIFRFLDVNKDGKIDSSDLFKVHNFLEQIVEKIQAFKSESVVFNSMNQSFQSENTLAKIQDNQIEQNQSHIKSSKQKTQTKAKMRQKTGQSQKMDEESYQIYMNLMNKNLQNLKAFQKLIQILNLRFIQKDRSVNKKLDSYNPQIEQYKKNTNSSKINSQIRYLEEALLKNKQLKISDLTLILDEVFYQSNKTKKKVIDIDYKKLNLKLSSPYVQTFTATNHNEETRINRELLQSLKDSLKNQQKQNNPKSNLLETKTLPAISYSQFYDEKLFVPFKNIFFQCLHTDIIQGK